jgi:hypothetical protein
VQVNDALGAVVIPRFDSRQGQEIFVTTIKMAVGKRQSIWSVPAVSSSRAKRPKREAAIHLHIVSRSRIRGALPPCPHYVYGIALQFCLTLSYHASYCIS